MAQKHVSHHENERDGELNLELIETSYGPLTEILDLEGKQYSQDHYAINEKHVGPEVNHLVCWVVQLVNQSYLEKEDEEHQVELGGQLKVTFLQTVSKDDDLVEQDKQSQVHGCLAGLLLRDGVQELLFGVLELKGQEVLGSLDQIVILVLSCVLNDNSIV